MSTILYRWMGWGKKETPVFESRKLDIADIPDIPEITWHQSTQRISPIEYPRNNVITIEPQQPQQSPNTPSSERFFQQYTTETSSYVMKTVVWLKTYLFQCCNKHS